MTDTATVEAKMVVEIQHVAAQPTAAVHLRRNPARVPDAFGEYLPRIGAKVGRLGGQFCGPPFLVYHGMLDGELDVELGMPVSHAVVGLPELARIGLESVGTSELPAGRVAKWIYRGPYAGLGQGWNQFNAWLIEHGHGIDGTTWESYLDSPDSVPADELRTVFYIRI